MRPIRPPFSHHSVDSSEGSGSKLGRNERSSSEEAWSEAMALMSKGPLDRPAWNMDTLKTAILFGKEDDVANVFESSTFRPREPGFTSLINFFGRLRDWRKAQEVFRAMRTVVGIRPNTFTFSALISACSSSGEWERALEIFEEMKVAARADPACRPNAVTYSALITACERGGHCEKALDMYQDMLVAGIAPDQGTYTAAISSCLCTARWRDAEGIFEAMHGKGFIAPTALYSDLLVKFANEDDFQKGVDFFLTAQMVGVEADIQMCRSLMGTLDRCDQQDMAVELLRSMREAGIGIDVDTYNSALNTVARAGDYKRATKILKSIGKDGLEPDVDTVAAVVEAYNRAGKREEAAKIKEDFKAKGLDIDNPEKVDVDAGFLELITRFSCSSDSPTASNKN